MAIFLVGNVVDFAGMLLLGIWPLTGLAETVVEAFSNHGLDNLTVQVAVAAVTWLLLS